MGGMMGAGMGAWVLLWIFLGLVVTVTAGVVVARALGTRRGPEPPPLPHPSRPPCGRPGTPCGCGTRTARSTGNSTFRARSTWKTDTAEGHLSGRPGFLLSSHSPPLGRTNTRAPQRGRRGAG